MNIDPTTGGSAAVGAMVTVLLSHAWPTAQFTSPELTAIAAGIGVLVAASAAAIRAMWRKSEKETSDNA